MRAICLLFLALSIGSILPGGVSSQTLRPEAIAEINAAGKARARLRSGGWVTLDGPRADTAQLSFTRGQLLNRGGSWVELPSPLPLTQVDRIEVAHGTRAGRGAAIGGGIMAALTLVAIIGCSGDYCEPTSGEALRAFVVWTAVGAGVGALIGSGSPRWEPVN